MWQINLCWIFSLFGSFQIIDGANLYLYKGSLTNYDMAPLDSAESLLDSLGYNSSLPNFIFTTGYTGTRNGTTTMAVISALCKLNEKNAVRNVFFLDWEKEASNRLKAFGTEGLLISYVIYALPGLIKVGVELGDALSRMSDLGFFLNRTELGGHSIGAHLFGFTGRTLKQSGKTVARITGIDPARPLFEDPRIISPLGRDCASFVWSIHTSPGGYGMYSSDSHVDIYVNFRYFIKPTDQHVQPGCPTGYGMFSMEGQCSHNRSWMLLIESWFHNHTLQASKASDYYEWEAIGNTTQTVYIGDDIDTTARGKFFMSTNNHSLYGKGAAGLYP